MAINEQKATAIVEHIAYDPLDDTHSPDIFAEQKREDLGKGFKAERHIYDYVFADSSNERTFVGELDSSAEAVVYAKLPKAFYIPTPVGHANPDWAIYFWARPSEARLLCRRDEGADVLARSAQDPGGEDRLRAETFREDIVGPGQVRRRQQIRQALGAGRLTGPSPGTSLCRPINRRRGGRGRFCSEVDGEIRAQRT